MNIITPFSESNCGAVFQKMLRNTKAEIDRAEEAGAENIRISVDQNDWFTLKEAETVTTYKWEYGQPLYIRVLGQGLTSGEHQVKLTVATRTVYISVPPGWHQGAPGRNRLIRR